MALTLDSADYNKVLDGIVSVANDPAMTILNYPTFNERMYAYMQIMMERKNISVNMILDNINNPWQNSSYVTDDYPSIPAEAEFNPFTMNYMEAANAIKASTNSGQHSTTNRDANNPDEIKNLYPNQSDSGELRDDEWNFAEGDYGYDWVNKNSLLYKTKQLFKANKIKSLVEKFGTNTEGDGSETVYNGHDVSSAYGMSKGRNLLTKDAEKNGGSYPVKGYNNPFCRVWTYFHQYEKLKDTMRPFKDGDDSMPEYRSIKDAHSWGERWKSNVDPQHKEKSSYFWKDGLSSRWDLSVLNGRGDGILNITPKWNDGTPIHPKDCMFSIENLAWKDYNPYSFDTALSWEQRGPHGGRIMWFPPYGLSFQENSNVQWNANNFIGRGEDVYTYINTKRTGTLSFYLVVDHPSILDYSTWYTSTTADGNGGKITRNGGLTDNDAYRFFAGCDPMDITAGDKSMIFHTAPTPRENEDNRPNPDAKPEENKPPQEEPPAENVETVKFCVFYPNNYSGMFDCDDKTKGPDFVMKYLLAGRDAQQGYDYNETTGDIKATTVDVDLDYPRGYEMGSFPVTDGDADMFIIGNKYPWKESGNNRYVADFGKQYKYRIDGTYEPPKGKGEIGNSMYSNTYAQTMKYNPDDYSDKASYNLNSSLDNQANVYGGTVDENAYTFSEVAEAVYYDTPDMMSFFNGPGNSYNKSVDRVGHLYDLFTNHKLVGVDCMGVSNSHGNNQSSETNETRNRILATQRGKTIVNWLKKYIDFGDVEPNYRIESGVTVTDDRINSLTPKQNRMAMCTLTFQTNESEYVFESDDEYKNDTDVMAEVVNNVTDQGNGGILKSVMSSNPLEVQSAYKKVSENLKEAKGISSDTEQEIFIDSRYNKIRYDQEYFFFKKMKEESPLVWKKFTDKVQYFDPAFHSMTPEGFNARLTFLNQCTRQGNTVGVSSGKDGAASNMAFGRPPFCVLRVGDFYNQMIVIESVNIEYDVSEGITWDLNDEGAGVQPMLAKVTISFNFIGGGSLGGAVRRLQNAMSFNYYANTELYDNRADQMTYFEDPIAMGGGKFGKVDTESSKFRSVEVYNENFDTEEH